MQGFGFAESEGFEPPVPRRVQQISSLPHSTTLATLLYLMGVVPIKQAANIKKISFYFHLFANSSHVFTHLISIQEESTIVRLHFLASISIV